VVRFSLVAALMSCTRAPVMTAPLESVNTPVRLEVKAWPKQLPQDAKSGDKGDERNEKIDADSFEPS